MRADVTILPWDGAPSPQLQRQVERAATALAQRLGSRFKLWVWLERTTDEKGGIHYVRLEVGGLPGTEEQRVRVDSTAASWEQAFRRAMTALNALLQHPLRLTAGSWASIVRTQSWTTGSGKRPWMGTALPA
jgi:hypothetical protein